MLVLDASAAVDLLLDEAVGQRVARLVQADDVLTPELFDVEVMSVLARLVRAGTLPADAATTRIRSLQRLPVRRVPHLPLARRAWELRDRVRITDAFYVSCTELVGGALVTTDARLGRAALPGVTVTYVS